MYHGHDLVKPEVTWQVDIGQTEGAALKNNHLIHIPSSRPPGKNNHCLVQQIVSMETKLNPEPWEGFSLWTSRTASAHKSQSGKSSSLRRSSNTRETRRTHKVVLSEWTLEMFPPSCLQPRVLGEGVQHLRRGPAGKNTSVLRTTQPYRIKVGRVWLNNICISCVLWFLDSDGVIHLGVLRINVVTQSWEDNTVGVELITHYPIIVCI